MLSQAVVELKLVKWNFPWAWWQEAVPKAGKAEQGPVLLLGTVSVLTATGQSSTRQVHS